MNLENKRKMSLKNILLHEVGLNRLMEFHSKSGYIAITAFRNTFSLEENYKRNKILKIAIDASQYSYFVGWGGYIEGGVPVKEKVFIISNIKKGSNVPMEDMEELKEFGQRLCNLLHPPQDSFLYVPKGNSKEAFYITPSGDIDNHFTNYSPTRAIDQYFTSLNKSRKKVEQDFTRKSITYRDDRDE